MPFRLGAMALLTSAIALAGVQGAPGAQADGGTPTPGNLSHLAAINHLSPATLSNILATDKTAHLDRTGHMFYVEPAPKMAPAGTSPPRAQSSTAGSTVSSVPQLSSRPSSTHKIFLDFNGTTVSASSAWATAPSNAIPAGTYSGFSLDGDPSTYTPAEVSYIQTVWKIVSEKYSMYDVDVTTIDPGAANYTRGSTTADINYGDHVVITDDPAPVNDVCGGGCAGVAYVGVFDGLNNAQYDPVWVFSSKDFGSAQLAAHDAAHEIGHTFGLSHDGTNAMGAGSYYGGQNNWVPIMGLTDQNAIAQFSKGEYPDANNTQDDLAIIGANGNDGSAGSLLLPDDYPNTTPDALGAQTSYALDGIISNAADDDLFSVTRSCTSDLTATATGIGAGQTVDLKVEILDGSNNVLASGDPTSGQTFDNVLNAYTPTGMDASATQSAPAAGTYRIRVSGVGSAANGYTNYASIGQYHLTITGCASTLPDAPATASASPNPRTTTGTVSWTAPASDGGSTITHYKVSGLPGGPVTLGNVLTYDATNLVPGTTYPVTVAAINGVGTGPTASTSLKVDTWAPTTKPVLTVTKSGHTANLSWTAPANPGGAVLTGWHIAGSGPSNSISDDLGPSPLSGHYDNLAAGTQSFTVTGVYTATDTAGVVASDPKSVLIVNTTAPTGKPILTVSISGTTATLQWTPPANPGGAVLNHWTIHRSGPGVLPSDKTVPANLPMNTTTMTGLAVGTQTFTITGDYTADDASNGVPSDPKSVSVAIKPGAPKIGTASSGAKHGPKTATARWSAPASNGGASITSYKVVAYQLNSKGHIVKTFTSKALSGSARSYSWALPGGHYKFRVVAYNRIGGSPYSGYSGTVISR